MGFLNECTIEPLRNKIGQYLTSLENIISTEKGERRDKAQQLYNQYKKITYLTFLDTRPDRALARKWDSNRSRNQFHIHQPTFTNDGTNNVKQSDYEDEIFVPSSPSKEQEIYHHNYIEDPEGENDLTPPRPKSEIPVVNSWDSFEIDDIDIIKIFNSLRNSNLPRKNPESAILGILGLTRQHKLTKNKLITIWSDLLNDFQLDIYVHLSIAFDLVTRSLDPYQDKFRKYWSEQQLTASRERRKEANKERARIGQKTDIIIELLTGPALICEVSGGLPAGTYKLHESHSVWLSSNWFTVKPYTPWILELQEYIVLVQSTRLHYPPQRISYLRMRRCTSCLYVFRAPIEQANRLLYET
ncbi:unnamed protein product [Rhizophagus irregularis]|nr:unnamed protein product [Rhizophagus irregularis]